AIQATRVDVAPALKEIGAAATPRGRMGLGFSQVLVVVQVVLSLALLIGAALFGRTLANLHAIPAGFDRDHVLLFSIRPAAVGYRDSALSQLFERVRGEIARVPGVQDVGLSAAPLPMGGGTMTRVAIEGEKPAGQTADGSPPAAVVAMVGPGFFTTMRIRLQGREFTERDDAASGKVAVVNRRLAKILGVDNPIGRTLMSQDERFEIIGVVDDALSFTLKETRRPAAYFSYLQASRNGIRAQPGQMTYEVRTAGNALRLAPAVRQTIRQIDQRLAIYDLKSQATYMDQEISTQVTLARLCLAFAVLALIIACVGVYGTMSFAVTRRTNEIGIRMTLGAARVGILWMVLRQAAAMTAVGLAIGVPLALFGSRYVRSLLYQVAPNDPVAIATGVGSLVVCGLIAAAIPAHRASRIDPLSAIRHE
ncbi:MAG: FtsX-like permease family protein, partial [Vicinamibacterales bacterium]